MRVFGKVLSYVLIGGFLAILLSFTALFLFNNLAFLLSPSIWPWNLLFIAAIAALFYVSWRRSRSSR